MIIYLLFYDEKCARYGKNTIEKIFKKTLEWRSMIEIFSLEISGLIISLIKQKTNKPIG